MKIGLFYESGGPRRIYERGRKNKRKLRGVVSDRNSYFCKISSFGQVIVRRTLNKIIRLPCKIGTIGILHEVIKI